MAKTRLNRSDIKRIEKAMTLFDENRGKLEQFAKALAGQLMIHSSLLPMIQFVKYRVKSNESLRRKLELKELERKDQLRQGSINVPELISAGNLFKRVNDLAGVRLIHLHTMQFGTIHKAILEILEEQQFVLIEDPTAKCWDSEYEKFYRDLDIRTEMTEGYSSVHYVVKTNTRSELTCELQVRTLTDEVWGEVSHRVNYPNVSPSKICREQLRTLARFTTGCTRLVDAIFASDAEARGSKPEA